MADLIIKPTSGTGNKLILQNQAGNAILTTGNSATDTILAPAVGSVQNFTTNISSAVTVTDTSNYKSIGMPISGVVPAGYTKQIIIYSVYVDAYKAGNNAQRSRGGGFNLYKQTGSGTLTATSSGSTISNGSVIHTFDYFFNQETATQTARGIKGMNTVIYYDSSLTAGNNYLYEIGLVCLTSNGSVEFESGNFLIIPVK